MARTFEDDEKRRIDRMKEKSSNTNSFGDNSRFENLATKLNSKIAKKATSSRLVHVKDKHGYNACDSTSNNLTINMDLYRDGHTITCKKCRERFKIPYFEDTRSLIDDENLLAYLDSQN